MRAVKISLLAFVLSIPLLFAGEKTGLVSAVLGGHTR